MNKGKKLYEGKAKIIYETNEKGLVIQHFKDDATAFNNLKKANLFRSVNSEVKVGSSSGFKVIDITLDDQGSPWESKTAPKHNFL